MTNPSSQEPQNPIPERRKKPAAGVTFDEMIAIIVAFGTIGTILFWSLGTKIGGVANNFGFGRQNSLLSTRDIGIDIGSVDADSDLDFGEIEQERDRLKIANEASKRRSSLALNSSSPDFDVASGLTTPSYQIDRRKQNRLAPIAVGAAIPTLTNRPNTNPVVTPDKTDSQVTAPDATATPDKTDSQATAPDATATPDKTDSQATAPDATATHDSTEIPEDVAPSYWAYPFVKQMSDKALVADLTEDRDFEPDKLITRASMATLISQAFENQPKNKAIKKFRDVTNKNAIAADIDKAVGMGFMQGYSDNEFRPLENIPRYQVLVTLATGLGLKPSQDATKILQKFGDGLDMPDWAKQQVAAAAEAGLIVNRPNVAANSLSPQKSATRAEVAAMIHQALVKAGKLQPLESEYILKP